MEGIAISSMAFHPTVTCDIRVVPACCGLERHTSKLGLLRNQAIPDMKMPCMDCICKVVPVNSSDLPQQVVPALYADRRFVQESAIHLGRDTWRSNLSQMMQLKASVCHQYCLIVFRGQFFPQQRLFISQRTDAGKDDHAYADRALCCGAVLLGLNCFDYKQRTRHFISGNCCRWSALAPVSRPQDWASSCCSRAQLYYSLATRMTSVWISWNPRHWLA